MSGVYSAKSQVMKACKTCGELFTGHAYKLFCTRKCHPNNQQRYKAPVGMCEICGLNKKLYRDHCHKSGKQRGMICNRCNSLLAAIDDNVFLAGAVKYLLSKQ
jgi:hypothetical protein